jgi:hypothetical protein
LTFLHPLKCGQSALQQPQAQLSNDIPYELKEIDLSNFKGLTERYGDFYICKDSFASITFKIFDLMLELT